MSTKQNPGKFDCLAKLADDEPYFVIRGKDPNGPALVELWASLRLAQYGEYPKLAEARECAAEMRRWKAAHPELKPTVPAPAESAQPCGCDPGAQWVCEKHRTQAAQ